MRILTISVYIPTRNRVDLLAAAVRSVLAQDCSNFELIVVDDASNDGTASFLESTASEDKRIRVIRNDSPRGAPASRNRAITQAIGDFITGLDDDDEFEPQRLGALHESWASFARYNVPVSCIFAQDVFVSDGKDIGVSKKRGAVEFADLIETNHIGNQIFAPKSVFEGAGLFDERLPAWQDLELFMRIVKRFGTARLLDMPLYRFDVTPSRDRISSKQDKVRAAYKLVSDMHFSENPRGRQRLMLQVFSPYYGIRPTLKDTADFAGLGLWPRGLASLIKKMF
ncbi:MAG TPA: glycosyltransferase [Candidatus Saccharimonadales bacterium]|nr:glycosyltransferase [Candidatus Saccharimonadales bacterium]